MKTDVTIGNKQSVRTETSEVEASGPVVRQNHCANTESRPGKERPDVG